MTIMINNDQQAFPVDEALLKRAVEMTLALHGGVSNAQVGVTLVDDEAIRQLNQRFRGIDRPTDVLSFPMIDGMLAEASPAALLGCVDPETGALELGDLVICPARAAEQAQDYGHSLQRELGYLCAHGMLHLLGYDHEDEDERAVMRQKEEKALAALSLSRD